jgi:DNA-binding NarL/FixJ family response regulator
VSVAPVHSGAADHLRLVRVSVDDDVLRRRILGVLKREGIASAARSTAEPGDLAVVAERCSATETARVVEELRGLGSAMPIVLVVRPGGRAGSRAARLADGVILDTSLEETLGTALRAVHAGLRVEPRGEGAQPALPLFSPREKEVLALLVLGFSNALIARRLHVAEATVKSHLSSCFRKLAVRSRAEACARILDPAGGLGLGILGLSASEAGSRLEPAW